MAYASGKHALGICDRCGWQCRYLDMKKEWTGLKVCSECYESKHPQLTPAKVFETESLFEPRPETRLPKAQLGVVTTIDPNPQISTTGDSIGTVFSGATSGDPFKMSSEIGDLTVSTS